MSFVLKKVLISDNVDPSCRQILENGECGISVDYKPGLSKEDLLAIIGNYDGLIVRSATKVTREVIEAATNLKLIGRAGTGVDNIDLEAATERGVVVMNTPGGNTISAAEHTCALICAVARNLPQGHHSMKNGKWDRKKFMGIEVLGKTLAIIGLGRVGREVAIRMQSFGMRTVGYDPLVPAEIASQFGVEFMELEQIWPIADFITVHTPLIPATRGLINDATFAKGKKGVRLVNVARGGIIDEDSLLRALESGQCGGAGLDVFVTEPPTNRALVDHEKIVATPHLGASTTEAQLKVAQEVAEQFVDAAKGKQLAGVVNAPYLTNALTPEARPWVQLAKRLGQLARALLGSPSPSSLTLTLPKSAGGYKDFLLPATLVGVLGSKVTCSLVNARQAAKKSGLTGSVCVSDGNEDAGCRVVVVECATSEGVTVRVEGVVLGCKAFVVAIGDQKIGQFVELEGKLLVVEWKKAELVGVVSQVKDAREVVMCESGDMVLVRCGEGGGGELVKGASKTTQICFQ